MTLRRWVRRQLLRRRAKRVKFEREFLEIDEFISRIRESARNHPIPKEPHEYAD